MYLSLHTEKRKGTLNARGKAIAALQHALTGLSKRSNKSAQHRILCIRLPRQMKNQITILQVRALKELIRPNTRAVFVNFPHNPSGAVASHEEWHEIVECCRHCDAYLFSDEMYR